MAPSRVISIGLITVLLSTRATSAQQPAVFKAMPPEIPLQSEADWINSEPLRLTELRGQVVVLTFWTFG